MKGSLSRIIGCMGLFALSMSAPLSATDYTELALQHCADAGNGVGTSKPEGLDEILDAERGTYPEEQVLSAMATSAAIDIARTAENEKACEDTLRRGQARFDDAFQKNEKQIGKKKHRLSRDQEIMPIQQKIIDLWVKDQASRVTYIGLQTDDKTGADYWAQRLSVAHSRLADQESRNYMKELLQDWDWIDRKRFGGAVSDHAWILVQHADADPAFQAMVLERMEPFLESKGIRPKHYAYLWDRVAVNTGQKQRYGTQPDWQCNDGKMQLRPLEDPARVNEWRAQMGLNSVEEGLAEMERNTCR